MLFVVSGTGLLEGKAQAMAVRRVLRRAGGITLVLALVLSSVAAQPALRPASMPQADPAAAKSPGAPRPVFPADHQRIDATQWRLVGQISHPGRDGVSVWFSVQDVTAGMRWLAREVPGSVVDLRGRSSFLVTGLVDAHTYRWSMSERTIGPASAAVRAATRATPAWSTFMVDTALLPAPTVTSASYPEGAQSQVRPSGGSFRFNDASGDVGGWEYRADGSGWSAPTRDPSLDWNPVQPGSHTLTVRAVNSAGRPGAETAYQFTIGDDDVPRADPNGIRLVSSSCPPGAVVSPTPGFVSYGPVLLAASAPSSTGCGYVSFQYAEFGGSLTFVDIPPSDVSYVASGLHPSWPIHFQEIDGSSLNWQTLRWNLAKTMASIDPTNPSWLIQACWYPTAVEDLSSSTCSKPQRVDYDPHAFGGASGNASVGPGTLSLASGDFSVSSNDATASSPFGDVVAGRSFTTLQPSLSPPNSGFGHGWVANFAGSASAAADSVDAFVDLTSGTAFATLTAPDGLEHNYSVIGVSNLSYPFVYTGSGADATNGRVLTQTNATTVTLTDVGGNQVVWTSPDGGTTWRISRAVQSNGLTTRYVTDASGRISAIVAPAPPGISCDSFPLTTAGCRSLTIDYASATTATGTAANQWGDYSGDISDIVFHAADPSNPTTMAAITLAQYRYDSGGWLREAFDPRVTGCSAAPCLPMTYSYDGNGRLASVTPSGLNPWNLGYDSHGRLGTVSRADPAGGTDTTTIIYNVPVTGAAGLPSTNPHALRSAYQPGQSVSYFGDIFAGGTGTPSTATAIFPPTHSGVTTTYDVNGAPTGVTAADWPYSSLSYVDDQGFLVDTAVYGAGAWQVGYTNHDLSGRVVNTVSAQAIDECANPSAYPLMDDYVANQIVNAGVPCDSVAALMGTTTAYRGIQLYQVTGPAHEAFEGSYIPVGAGTPPNTGNITSDGQLVTTHVYDENAPGGGILNLETSTHTSFNTFNGFQEDPLVQQLGYAAISSGDPTGWTLRRPTTNSTVLTNGTGTITRTTRYNAQGQVVETRMPSNPSGFGAGSVLTTYYTAIGTGACINAAAAGLVCQVAPAGQPTSGPALPTTTTRYNVYGQPLTTTESNATTTRTTTVGYDPAGRKSSQAITVTPAANGGTPVPATSFGFDPNTGEPVTLSAAGGATTTTGYDADGRVVRYQDGSQPAATVTYDADGRVAVGNDGQGTVTYTYDAGSEHRGLPTTMVDSQAGTFTATYDAAGRLTGQTYPNGVVATRAFDDGGALRSLTYTKAGATWVNWSDQYSTHGQLGDEMITSGPLVEESNTLYYYDAALRLSGSLEYNGEFGSICNETRTYTYDADSNRTVEVGPQPPTDGNYPACTTTQVTTGHTYDQADRATDVVGGEHYTYDDLGRTLTVPGADVVSTPQSSDQLTVHYYANDMVAFTSAAGNFLNYGLDPAGRTLTTSGLDGDGQPWTTTNDYTSGSDSPAWTSTTGSAGTSVTRYTTGLDGLTTAESFGSTSMLYLNDPRGNVVARLPYTATGLIDSSGWNSYTGYTDFGIKDLRCHQSQCNASITPYGYLGGHERTTANTAGVLLMGRRLYNPTTGRFLQPDPVPGGSANAYDYAGQDPINNVDLNGTDFVSQDWGSTVDVFMLWGFGQSDLGGVITPYDNLTIAVNNCMFYDASVCPELPAGWQDVAGDFYLTYGTWTTDQSKTLFPLYHTWWPDTHLLPVNINISFSGCDILCGGFACNIGSDGFHCGFGGGIGIGEGASVTNGNGSVSGPDIGCNFGPVSFGQSGKTSYTAGLNGGTKFECAAMYWLGF
jgi:RHS repeat-associated protein